MLSCGESGGDAGRSGRSAEAAAAAAVAAVSAEVEPVSGGGAVASSSSICWMSCSAWYARASADAA